MRELGLSYDDKPKKEKINTQLPIFQREKIQREEEGFSVERKVKNYLEKTEITQALLKKGEIRISRHARIGSVRGAEIGKKIVKPYLKNIGIDCEFRYDEGELVISISEWGKRKLSEEIEGKIKRG